MVCAATLNPPEGRLIPASTRFGRLAGIGSLTGGFGSFDWRVLGRVLAGFETMTWEDENALGGSGFRPRDLLRAITRPPWRFRYAGFGKSVYRLGWGRYTDRVRVGIPTCPNSVYRLARLGLPTHTHSVYRLCRRPRATPRTAVDCFRRCGFNELPRINKWYNAHK